MLSTAAAPLATSSRPFWMSLVDFGASAPYEQLYAHFGITAEGVAAAARAKLD